MSVVKTLTLPPRAEGFDLQKGSLYFVGTATVLLRYAGLTILTDPNFLHQGDHVHLGYGLTSRRVTMPAIEFDQLPDIDLVVLSHTHEDHFDRLVQQRLRKTIPILTTPQAASKLTRLGFQDLYPLRTWDAIRITKGQAELVITSMPTKHGPIVVDALLPQVMGSMLEFQSSSRAPIFKLYITGDTLIHQRLREIPLRFPDIDLALVHLGGTRLFGILLTMDANQGVEMLRIVRPRRAIPVHYNDYTAFKSPLEDFQRAVAEAGLESQVSYIHHGETYEFHVPPGRLRAA